MKRLNYEPGGGGVDLFHLPYVLLAALLTSVIGIAVIVLMMLRKRAAALIFRFRKPVEVEQSPIAQTMHELEAIHKKGKDTAEQLVDVGDVLRRFIETEMGIPAPDMTTSELIPQLRDRLPERRVAELQRMLEMADLAKFAPIEVKNLRRGGSPTEFAVKWLRGAGFEA